MLDRLSPPLRHLALLVLAAFLSWLGTDGVPLLTSHAVPWLTAHPGWGPLAAVALTVFLAWATPLTRQYGAQWGSDGADTGAATVRVVTRWMLVFLAVALLVTLVVAAASAPPVHVAVVPWSR